MKPGKKPFAFKVCPSCGINKHRSEYYKKLDTVSHRCKPCSLANQKERASNYFGKYREYQNRWRREKYQTEPSYREKVSEKKIAWYRANQESLNERRRLRWSTDPNDPARKHSWRKNVKRATPPWADIDAIITVYATCPEGHDVDHIVPIKGLVDGRPVCGLHVHWNLQHLPTITNRKKRNRISESDLIASKVKR